MREPYTQLYLHLVWATWDRLPLISEDIKPRIYAAIAEKCRELKCVPLAIGGISDHVHLLVRFYTTIAVADLVKEVKGSSSHLVTHEITPDVFFKWQGAYGAFTIRKSEVSKVMAYIQNQEQHHAKNQLQPEFEQVVEDG
jgi:REP element-mobilizing transposase RayT